MFESNNEYHQADEALSQRIASFKWVTPQHLDIKPESWNQDLWDTATTGMPSKAFNSKVQRIFESFHVGYARGETCLCLQYCEDSHM